MKRTKFRIDVESKTPPKVAKRRHTHNKVRSALTTRKDRQVPKVRHMGMQSTK